MKEDVYKRQPLIIRFREKLFIKIADIKHAPAADTLKK